MITGVIDLVEHEKEELNKRVKEYKREADHDIRSQGLGGTDMSVIFDVNPFKNIIQLWDEKVGNVAPPDLSDNEKIRWGILLEDTIAKEFAYRMQKKVRHVNRTLRHREYPFLQGHIDRKIENENAGLEVKAVGLRQSKFWEDGVPDHYQIQVHHYMTISNYDMFYVAALVGGQELKIHTIDRDENMVEKIIEKGSYFWKNHVLTKLPPPPKTTIETALLYPNSEEGKVVYLSKDMNDLPAKYFEKLEEKERIDKEIDVLKTQFQDKMQDASYLEDSEGERVASWPTYYRSGTDLKTMKKKEPKICAKYETKTSYRQFRVNPNYRREND